MSLILAMLFAAAMQDDSYPAEALKNKEEGTVVTLLDLDANGGVLKCEVEKSSGSTSLDAASCPTALKQPKFQPAADPSAAVASRVRLPIGWKLPTGGKTADGTVATGTGDKKKVCKMERSGLGPPAMRCKDTAPAGGDFQNGWDSPNGR